MSVAISPDLALLHLFVKSAETRLTLSEKQNVLKGSYVNYDGGKKAKFTNKIPTIKVYLLTHQSL